jgi:hypothetical protein
MDSLLSTERNFFNLTKIFAYKATERDENYSQGNVTITSTVHIHTVYIVTISFFSFSWFKPWDFPPKLFNETAGDETENVGVPCHWRRG